jgi:hypothetical protein
MFNTTLFCVPVNTYRGRPEKEVSAVYAGISVVDFDKLVSFDKDYKKNFMEKPDYTAIVGKKGNRKLILSSFVNQPVTHIGKIKQELTSSNHLFNPTSIYEDENLLLPDLDVIEIEGASDLREAVRGLKRFYENNGWKVTAFEGKFPQTIQIPPSQRFSKPVSIVNPHLLLKIANEQTNYNPYRTCF